MNTVELYQPNVEFSINTVSWCSALATQAQSARQIRGRKPKNACGFQKEGIAQDVSCCNESKRETNMKRHQSLWETRKKTRKKLKGVALQVLPNTRKSNHDVQGADSSR
jgi:hypothetical protein